MKTPDWEALRAFRHQVYTLFGCRRDALFEALDAILSAPTLETPAHLSLAPHCPRGWGSLYDALNAGTLDMARLERLVAAYPLSVLCWLAAIYQSLRLGRWAWFLALLVIGAVPYGAALLSGDIFFLEISSPICWLALFLLHLRFAVPPLHVPCNDGLLRRGNHEDVAVAQTCETLLARSSNLAGCPS